MLPKSYPSVATLASRAGDNVEWQKGGNDHSLASVSAKKKRRRQGGGHTNERLVDFGERVQKITVR